MDVSAKEVTIFIRLSFLKITQPRCNINLWHMAVRYRLRIFNFHRFTIVNEISLLLYFTLFFRVGYKIEYQYQEFFIKVYLFKIMNK